MVMEKIIKYNSIWKYINYNFIYKRFDTKIVYWEVFCEPRWKSLRLHSKLDNYVPADFYQHYW